MLLLAFIVVVLQKRLVEKLNNFIDYSQVYSSCYLQVCFMFNLLSLQFYM